jgi:serine protein kinase
MLAQFSVLSRTQEPENSNIFSKMRIYDGENLKDTDPKAKTIQEYRDAAGVDEGMDGLSTRFAFKILSKVFNFDATEVAANPVHLMYVLEQQIEQQNYGQEIQDSYLRFIKEYLAPKYVEFIGKEIQTAYLESYSEYGQNIFDRYVTYADFWIQDQEYRDPETGDILDRASLNEELEKIEKPAGISNPKDFRNEIVNFVLRARANNNGTNPSWLSYEKLRTVIEKKMFSNTEDLLPVISFNAKSHELHHRSTPQRQEQECGQSAALSGTLQKAHQEGGCRCGRQAQYHRPGARRRNLHSRR